MSNADIPRDKSAKGTWVTFRPEIKIHDCTVRDGGLMNSHRFDDGFVRTVYETLLAAGVDYMEVGYKTDKKLVNRSEFGDWKFCDEDDIRRVIPEKKGELKLSAMADAERTDYHNDILPREKSVLDCIRVATYIHQIPTALDMVKDAHDKGYETAVNIMAISTVRDAEVMDALDTIAKSPVNTVYLVDSFGSLYSEQIRYLTLAYLRAIEGTGKQIGIHAHNNMMLAYANTIEALIVGANRLDVTINGLGRGAGNCPLELLISFLKNPKFHLRPVLQCIQEHFLPLGKKIDWGYSIPYLITGWLNEHPRAAIKVREGDNPDDYLTFFDQMVEEE